MAKEKCINYPKECKSRGVINALGECAFCVNQQARRILLIAIKNDMHNLHNNYATIDWVRKWRDYGASFGLIAIALNNGITSQDIRRFMLGIEPAKNEKRSALNLPELITIPACPICGATHTHAHGEVVYPAGTLTYDGATQEVKPLSNPSKRRDTRKRLHVTVSQTLYETVKGQANFEGTTMDAIVRRGVMLAIYDYQAIMNRQPDPEPPETRADAAQLRGEGMGLLKEENMSNFIYYVDLGGNSGIDMFCSEECLMKVYKLTAEEVGGELISMSEHIENNYPEDERCFSCDRLLLTPAPVQHGQNGAGKGA